MTDRHDPLGILILLMLACLALIALAIRCGALEVVRMEI